MSSEAFYTDDTGRKCDAEMHEGNEAGEHAVSHQAVTAAVERGVPLASALSMYGHRPEAKPAAKGGYRLVPVDHDPFAGNK